MIRIEVFQQHALDSWLPLLAKWRIQEFSHFPYLYDGTAEEEAEYTRAFAKKLQACMVIAFDELNQPVGLCTGHPQSDDLDKLQSFGEKCFYLSEILVASTHRGQGIAGLLMDHLEKNARAKGYDTMTLLCVKRDEKHPFSPPNYVGPDSVWLAQGYHKLGISIDYVWRTRQWNAPSQKQQNEMQYWGKRILLSL